jgi:hypothetical protein
LRKIAHCSGRGASLALGKKVSEAFSHKLCELRMRFLFRVTSSFGLCKNKYQYVLVCLDQIASVVVKEITASRACSGNAYAREWKGSSKTFSQRVTHESFAFLNAE